MPKDPTGRDHADRGWDNHAERVLRNEGRLEGLERLFEETRQSDGKLTEQTREALAKDVVSTTRALLELVTARADAVLTLSKEERESDRREVELRLAEHDKYTMLARDAIRREGEVTLNLLREVYDTAITQIRESMKDGLDANLNQSQAAIHELELRRVAATEKVEQMVRQWRESDREARELFAAETQRHLEQLNHANERIAKFQAESVTRELWQSEKDATATREGLIRDSIIALEKTVLGMTPLTSSDKAHAELRTQVDVAIKAATEVLSNSIGVVNDKVNDLRSYRDTITGRDKGYGLLAGGLVAAVSVIVSVIVVANALR